MVQIEQIHSLASRRYSRRRADCRYGRQQLPQPTRYRQLPDRQRHPDWRAELEHGKRVGGREAEGGRKDFTPIA